MCCIKKKSKTWLGLSGCWCCKFAMYMKMQSILPCSSLATIELFSLSLKTFTFKIIKVIESGLKK